MDLNKYCNEGEVIFVVPNELNSYFLELRRCNPRLNFKLLTLTNLFNELRGRQTSVNAINVAFDHFNDLTYKSIKQVLEIVYRSFKVEELKDEKINALKRDLEDKNLLFIDEDFSNLLRNRMIYFVNFEQSTLVKSLINFLNIKNYKYLNLSDVIDTSTPIKNYCRFFNILDESHYALNEILELARLNNDTGNIKIVLDVKRFNFYINYLLKGINVPFKISGIKTLLDTKTYKEIYELLNDESFMVLPYLEEHKDEIGDEYFDDVFNELKKYNIDTRKNKKTNVYEILGSIMVEDISYSNAITFQGNLDFSNEDNIFILGLDSNYMPKAKKNDTLYSYEVKNKLGLDSLDETNLMKANLEEAFLKQSSIKYISYHVKDNGGQYNPSYYFKSLGITQYTKNPVQNYDFTLSIAQNFYAMKVEQFKMTGEQNENLSLYNDFFEDKPIKLYSNRFTGLKNYEFDLNKDFSYSSLSNYFSCPFKYYCSRVLRIDASDLNNNTNVKLGNYAHYILERVYELDFDFDKVSKESYDAIDKANPFTDLEKIYLNKFNFELRKTCEQINEHKKNMNFYNVINEKKFFIDVPAQITEANEDVKDYIFKIECKPDSIIQVKTHEGDIESYIIDYKSGSEKFKKKGFVERQEHTQLPFYYYVLDKYSKLDPYKIKEGRFKNKNTIDPNSLGECFGCFIRPLATNEGKFYDYTNPSEANINSTKLSGYFLDQYDVIKNFDLSLINCTKENGKLDSEFIDGLKLAKIANNDKKKINLQKKSPIKLSEFKEFNDIIENYIINNAYHISKGNFAINPHDIEKGKDCLYCPFKDVCMKLIVVNDEEVKEESTEGE